MAKMTEKMQELFTKVQTVVLATVADDGTPNAVPVGAKKIVDPETILISDQYFNKTLVNMMANPRVCLLYWKGQEGYQLKGTVSIATHGQVYEETAQWIDEMSAKIGFPLKSKGAIVFKIEEIYDIAPGPTAGKRLV